MGRPTWRRHSELGAGGEPSTQPPPGPSQSSARTEESSKGAEKLFITRGKHCNSQSGGPTDLLSLTRA
eukprot:9074204-Pyramimonas_sp.AAC.1